MDRAEIALDCRNLHGEGVFWNDHDGRLWWTDIHGKKLWWFEPKSGKSASIPMPDRVCCFAPRRSRGLIVAFAKSVAFFDLDNGSISEIYRFETEQSETRLNDGRTDRQGRFIVGGMNEGSGAPSSTVIRVDPDGSVTTIISGVSCANSTCFSPDGRRMYFADSPVREIWSYDYDIEAGIPSNRRILVDLTRESGVPGRFLRRRGGSGLERDLGGPPRDPGPAGRDGRPGRRGSDVQADVLRLRRRGPRHALHHHVATRLDA